MSRSAEGSSCDTVLELLEAFVDRDLGPGEERMVAEHLDELLNDLGQNRVV